ncbi:MAG TPA: biotin--[acetyl-CoA-carboxylase] ligase [Vicinamibacterales bacterium]|nr:biotin--[acetyl-CoA-carboxylase] ligase [Vicinamibacterales bacterium]
MPEAPPVEFETALRHAAARLGSFGRALHYFSEIGSTNDEAARLAHGGAPQGTTVVAAAQTAGRGRFGRSWFSPPGAGLYVSVVCRNRRAVPYLTLTGGVAVAEGITSATGLAVEIKWPNDIMVSMVSGGPGRRRKLAGILAEASSNAGGVQFVVLGFGINLRPAAYPADIADRATSLESELGRPADAGDILAATLVALRTRMAELDSRGPAGVLSRWRDLAPSAQGHTVEWDGPTGVTSGRTAGLGDDGALLVQTAGQVERITSGTVRWL